MIQKTITVRRYLILFQLQVFFLSNKHSVTEQMNDHTDYWCYMNYNYNAHSQRARGVITFVIIFHQIILRKASRCLATSSW